MLKKVLVTSVLLLASSNAALAEPYAAQPYVGGSLGVTDLSVTAGRIHSGSIGKLFGGIGSIYADNIYLGGELNIDLASFPYYSGPTYGAGLSLIPGLMITKDTMFYGRVGIQADRRRYSSQTLFGNQLGLGVQTSLAKSWDVRGEYVRTSARGGDSQLNLGLVYKFG